MTLESLTYAHCNGKGRSTLGALLELLHMWKSTRESQDRGKKDERWPELHDCPQVVP